MATAETLTRPNNPDLADIAGIDSEIRGLQDQMRTTAPGSPQELDLYNAIRKKQATIDQARRSLVQASLEAHDDIFLKPPDAQAVAREAQEAVEAITQEHQIVPSPAPQNMPAVNGTPETRI